MNETTERKSFFPNSLITKGIKQLCKEKFISKKVKTETNIFLEKILMGISTEFSKSQYKTIEYEELQKAINKYQEIGKQELFKKKLLVRLEAMQLELESLKEELTQ